GVTGDGDQFRQEFPDVAAVEDQVLGQDRDRRGPVIVAVGAVVIRQEVNLRIYPCRSRVMLGKEKVRGPPAAKRP
ncbi:MAG: hypothetical protein JWM61_2544, partial [Micrococcaceae bacterium]|nr:hypothetical protein [Micrococcaceae bacterium]